MATSSYVQGAWGEAGDVILSLLPIVFLLVVTLVPWLLLRTAVSLPLAAILMWAIRAVYFGTGANFLNACLLAGVLDALTPISICFGAILLFETMDAAICEPWITNTIRRLSRGHPVGEIFLIGWAFAYCIEGAAGFGTPVALASPTLAALGHDPVMVVCCLLAMNTLGTPFGAAGTPIWFGFDGLALSEDELLRVSVITAALTGVSALIIPVLAASFLVPFTALRRCWIFVLVSIVSVAGPSVAVAIWSYEFPTLFGGICGMVVTSLLLHFHVGLYPVDDLMPPRDRPRDSPSPSDTDAPTTSTASKADDASEDDTADAANKATTTHNGSPNPSQPRENLINGKPASKAAVAAMRTFPLWGTVLLLVITRVFPQVKFGVVKRTSPAATVDLGSLGRFRLSAGLVVSLLEIFGVNSVSWSYEILYVPCFIPFVVVSVITIAMLRHDVWHARDSSSSSTSDSTRTSSAPGQATVDIKPHEEATEVHGDKNHETVTVHVAAGDESKPPSDASSSSSSSGTWSDLLEPFTRTRKRVANVVPALMGGLALVTLLRKSDTEKVSGAGGGSMLTVATLSPAYVVGKVMSGWFGKAWIAVSPAIGLLGTFFSGSTTVSNLTFGGVQLEAARNIGIAFAPTLALQAVGATVGNMICINNIISARAVMNLNHVPEMHFIRRTWKVCLTFYVLAVLLGLPFFFA